MACGTCEFLKSSIEAELDSGRKKEFKIAYRDHIDKVVSCGVSNEENRFILNLMLLHRTHIAYII